MSLCGAAGDDDGLRLSVGLLVGIDRAVADCRLVVGRLSDVPLCNAEYRARLVLAHRRGDEHVAVLLHQHPADGRPTAEEQTGVRGVQKAYEKVCVNALAD